MEKFFKFDWKGNLVGSYQKRKDTGYPPESITFVLDSGKKYKGFYWSRDKDYKVPTNGKYKMISREGEVVRSFCYVPEILEYLGISDNKNLYKAVRGKTLYRGYFWKKEK